MIPSILASLGFGYILGSIPFGLVLCFLFGYGDVRKIGSGNIGATNVLRTGNKLLAFLTLVLDSGKGAIAVLIAIYLLSDVEPQIQPALVALGAVLGHNFPVWLKFKGGKGVATTLGAILALSWPIGLMVCVTWLLIALIFKISSLAALVALAAAPWFALLTDDSRYAFVLGLLALLAFIRHRENIKRLLKGLESKISFKKGKS